MEDLVSKRGFKHGMERTRFYRIWWQIKQRCLNKNTKYFKNYGGRGITVCDKWLKFENFRDDMYKSYLKHVEKFGERKTSIDRIDNDDNYKKKNCRFVTPKDQANNRRNNIVLEFNGESLTMSQWSRKLNINYKALYSRIKRNWSIERALTK